VRYRIVHRTSYCGQEPVSVGHNQAWLEPRPVSGQILEAFSLIISPQPSVRTSHLDAFGNPVHLFSFNEGYSRLDVTATGIVSVRGGGPELFDRDPTWESVVEACRRHLTAEDRRALEFRFASPRIAWSPEAVAFAAESFRPGRRLIESVEELTKRIHAGFTYDNRATTVTTPVLDVFRQRRGVCQDFAHVQIAMLRGLGLPARYVSGYLKTVPPAGQERLVGADATHAWLSVYCGDGRWLDVDPTNDRFCSTDHITVAWGRDYSDVPPLTGVFVGGGQHKLEVSVDVEPLL
jgi:transglutaminase-like putative cysteine protease